MSEKLKIALIGAGNIANTHIGAYKRIPGVEVYAICDIDEKRLNITANQFGIERRYTDLDKMLSELPELDAASVCVWNCNHAECTIKALNAGLHVLCEKPMAYNTKEAIAMKEAAERNGKLLMIGFVLRFSNEAKIAKDLISKDLLGDIYYAKAQFIRRHGNPGGWFSDIERSGGGPVIDIGVHVIDLTRYLMGLPKPVSVYAVTNKKLGRRDYLKNHVDWAPLNASPSDPDTVEDFATALIRYDNGAVLSLETTYDINLPDNNTRLLCGTKGGLSIGEREMILYNDTDGFLSDVRIDKRNYKEAGDFFVAELSHFVDCITKGVKCQNPAEDGVEIMKILDAIYESARTGHEVVLD